MILYIPAIAQNTKEIDERNRLNPKELQSLTINNTSESKKEEADIINNPFDTISADTGKREAFTFETIIVADFVNNFSGGLKSSNCYLGLVYSGITFNTKNAGLWKGGQLFIRGLNTHGSTPAADIVGDLQTFSNIENGVYTFIYELCYKQNFGKLSIVAGVNDFNIRFASSEYCQSFINSSFGIQPSITMNVPVSIFPKNALGVVLRYEYNDAFAINAAIYDGDPGNLESDPYNIKWSINSNDGALAVVEFQYSFLNEEKKSGTYRFGGYYHTGDFIDFSADLNDPIKGNYGIYLLVDQMLFPGVNNLNEGLGMFLQLGAGPAKQNFDNLYIGAGLHYTGLFQKRNDDIFGLGIAYASFSKYAVSSFVDMLSYETAIEITYKAQICENFVIQPDIQYIINHGANSLIDNALLGLIRLELCY